MIPTSPKWLTMTIRTTYPGHTPSGTRVTAVAVPYPDKCISSAIASVLCRGGTHCSIISSSPHRSRNFRGPRFFNALAPGLVEGANHVLENHLPSLMALGGGYSP